MRMFECVKESKEVGLDWLFLYVLCDESNWVYAELEAWIFEASIKLICGPI